MIEGCWHAARAGLLALAAGAGAALAPSAAGLPQATPVGPVERPAWEGYRGHADPPAVPWAEANATVGRIGGWRSYARETPAQPPARAASAADTATPPGPPGVAPGGVR